MNFLTKNINFFRRIGEVAFKMPEHWNEKEYRDYILTVRKVENCKKSDNRKTSKRISASFVIQTDVSFRRFDLLKT